MSTKSLSDTRLVTSPPASSGFYAAADALDSSPTPAARPARKYVEGLLRTSDVFLGHEGVPRTLPALLDALDATLPLRGLVLVEAAGGEIAGPTTRSVGALEGLDLGRAEAHTRAVLAYFVQLAETLESDPMPGLEIALPLVGSDGAVVAVLLALASVAATEADLAFLDAVAAQLSLSLARDHRAEEERAAHDATRVALDRASALAAESRDRALAIVAHDLKQPLNAILLTVSALLGRWPGKEERRRFGRPQLEMIRRAANRMRRLSNDLLDVSSIGGHPLRIEPGPMVVSDLIDEAAAMLAPVAAARGVEIRRRPSGSLPVVWGDAGRILQVLVNLVDNAIKFTPAGGTITIHARALEDRVTVSIRDTGVGIRELDRASVFERFWQAKGTASLGAGLGLTIAKAIVEAHGGEIHVESGAEGSGSGATFTFALPVLPR